MIGPSSQISKALLTLLLLLVIFYVFMDVHLYLRIQNYPIDRSYHINSSMVALLNSNLNEKGLITTQFPQSSLASLDLLPNAVIKYSNVTWINCHINPLCDVVSISKFKLLPNIPSFLFHFRRSKHLCSIIQITIYLLH